MHQKSENVPTVWLMIFLPAFSQACQTRSLLAMLEANTSRNYQQGQGIKDAGKDAQSRKFFGCFNSMFFF
jgi:hypothetical protein